MHSVILCMTTTIYFKGTFWLKIICVFIIWSCTMIYRWVNAKKDVTSLLMHCSYVFLALTHQYLLSTSAFHRYLKMENPGSWPLVLEKSNWPLTAILKCAFWWLLLMKSKKLGWRVAPGRQKNGIMSLQFTTGTLRSAVIVHWCSERRCEWVRTDQVGHSGGLIDEFQDSPAA